MKAQTLFHTLNLIQSLLNWMVTRGMTRDRSLTLLERADAEKRDLTTAEVQTELDLSAAELADTRTMLDDGDEPT